VGASFDDEKMELIVGVVLSCLRIEKVLLRQLYLAATVGQLRCDKMVFYFVTTIGAVPNNLGLVSHNSHQSTERGGFEFTPAIERSNMYY
jgi:hypothetical protein